MSAAVGSRTQALPLVAVLYHVPLFLEAVASAFDGLARVQGLRVEDDALDGLLEVLQPDAVIVEAEEPLARSFAVPALQVDLVEQTVLAPDGDGWTRVACELSPEAIRNALFAAMLRAD